MAIEPHAQFNTHRSALRPFEARDAARVASWVVDSREALWVAPRTVGPITAATVRQWHLPGRRPFVLDAQRDDPTSAVAYGELNLLRRRRDFWLGHLIVDPEQRGRGFGAALVRTLLDTGFGFYQARKITLVVFPENTRAIRTYQSAGMQIDGYETHQFAAHGREERLVRMSIWR